MHTHMWAHPYTHLHSHTNICTHLHMHIHTNIHIQMHTHTHTHIYTHICICTIWVEITAFKHQAFKYHTTHYLKESLHHVKPPGRYSSKMIFLMTLHFFMASIPSLHCDWIIPASCEYKSFIMYKPDICRKCRQEPDVINKWKCVSKSNPNEKMSEIVIRLFRNFFTVSGVWLEFHHIHFHPITGVFQKILLLNWWIELDKIYSSWAWLIC